MERNGNHPKLTGQALVVALLFIVAGSSFSLLHAFNGAGSAVGTLTPIVFGA